MSAPHGTNARYIAGCRGPGGCDACRAAATLARKCHKVRTARTGPILIDSTAVRRHLRWLLSRGMGVRTIARIAGLEHHHVSRLADGTYRRCHADVARRILAVSTAHRSDAGYVPAAPTLARIAELLAHGFTRRQIALAAGYAPTTGLPSGARVRRSTELRIEAAHARLMAPIVAQREFDADRQRRYRYADREAPDTLVRRSRRTA